MATLLVRHPLPTVARSRARDVERRARERLLMVFPHVQTRTAVLRMGQLPWPMPLGIYTSAYLGSYARSEEE